MIKTKLFGRFQFIIKNVKTGKVTEHEWMENLVLNNAFTTKTITPSATIQLGTGSTPPTIADTSLETFLVSMSAGSPSATKAGASTDFVAPIYSTSAGWEETFGLGQVVGNVSEIGIDLTGVGLVTRALITDGAGDPTTITLGVDDILTVNYLMGYEIDTSHPPGSVTVDFGGQNIDLTVKWVDLGKGTGNQNTMNGTIFPYMAGYLFGSAKMYFIETLPSDPLSNYEGGVTPISYLSPESTPGVSRYTENITPTGSSWEFEITLTSPLGDQTGNWNGIGLGASVTGDTLVALFEFSETFVKAANQQVEITVKYIIQRA